MTHSLRIAVIGAGISGLSAAWLLSRRHQVTIIEAEAHAGGHSNTVDVLAKGRVVPIDTGFIVYNPPSYPNLVALFEHLAVPTAATNMSFAVSMDRGSYEYAGSGLSTVFGQLRNIARPDHWRMVFDTVRFFRDAKELIAGGADEGEPLGAYLHRRGYSAAFVARHIEPMAAAIWSTPAGKVLDFPAASFVRFFSNHGLLVLRDRPEWRTVVGGSREYVRRLLAETQGKCELGIPARRVIRHPDRVTVVSAGCSRDFDACVMATHADDTLALLGDADCDERDVLGAFRYSSNRAVLHGDARMMPRRRHLWSSWNYMGGADGAAPAACVTYWMNNLQPLGPDAPEYFVSLNPGVELDRSKIAVEFEYAHPVFDVDAMRAQRHLWRLQGRRRTWFCGSYFGYGFHEDGLQSGLAAAEDIGGVRRPWSVPNESSRIHILPAAHRSRRNVPEAAE